MKPPEPFRDLDVAPKEARRLGEAVVDMWVEYLERLRELPVDRGLREQPVRDAVVRDIGRDPMDAEDLVQHLRDLVFDQSMYPGHPGFMAYISGPGTVHGTAADLVAAFLNQNVGGWRLGPAATEIELALVRWLAGRFGLPEGAGGILQSGGAMASFVCLKAARDAIAGYEIRHNGVRGLPMMTMYCSIEAHAVIARAADMLGIGTSQVRQVGIDDENRMKVDELADALERDVADGCLPVAIVGTAGTTATGAIDPLPRLAEVARAHGVWFHVDAAYGGPVILSDELAPLLDGIQEADSIAVDPHKWLYTPLSGGCALLRDGDALDRSFGARPSYVYEDKTVTQRGIDLSQHGPQFSRGFAALKVWVSLLAHGTDAYGRRIAHDVALTKYLAALVEEHPELELMAPAPLSICCFRYVPEKIPDGWERADYLEQLNQRLMALAQTDGSVYYSNAVIKGEFCLRTCIVNFRTEAEDIDRVVEVTVRLGRALHEELSAQRPKTS